MLHTDQEAALKAILAKLQLYRGEDVQLMAEHTPVGESKSNGFIERTNQTAEGQIRTMKCALEFRLGCKLSPDEPVLA